MSQAELSRSQSRQLLALSWALVLSVGVMGALRASELWLRWTTVFLCLSFGALVVFSTLPPKPGWRAGLSLAIQTLVGAVLMYLHPDWSLFTALYYLASAQAMLLLPSRVGVSWIVGLAAITAGFGLYKWGWPGGLFTSLMVAGGYAFFAVFANALSRAEAAHRESQGLLAELQEAHSRLQEYAGRVEELAAVEERNRLAREMHDTLGHRLTVAAVQLEAAQRLCESEPERSKALVATVREQVREALSDLRTTVAALRTPIEADLHLRTSLKRLAAHFEDATGLPVHQLLPEDLPPIPPTHRLALFRAAQEALTNIQHHAGASQVWLVLGASASGVALLVGDDGKGVTLSGERAGYGLRGLRERATELGGTLHVEPRRGGGTQLSFRLPLPAEGATAPSVPSGPARSTELGDPPTSLPTDQRAYPSQEPQPGQEDLSMADADG